MFNDPRDKLASRRRTTIILVIAIAVAAIAICYKWDPPDNKQTSQANQPESTMNLTTNQSSENLTNENDERSQQMNIIINRTALTATMEDNTSAQALLDILKSGPLTLNMHDYGGMEKVGNLDTNLPTNDQQITTQPGDIILYQGNQITIYYDTNQWSLTKLGHIDNVSADELRQLLGDGNITAIFSSGE